ncbi:MAG: hypothetical protein IJ776_06465 [Paludibacteraceae bacterium]|nr:hypothetical protein [Paludibacteraceae bacterium]
MTYICREGNSDSLALVFAEKSGVFFCNISEYFRYNLTERSYIQSKLRHFHEADSLWNIAVTFPKDVFFRTELLETRIEYYYMQQEYDSVLNIISEIPTDQKSSYSIVRAAQCYFHKGKQDSAEIYALQVIKESKVLPHKISAYYILIDNNNNEDSELIKQYSAKRMDMKTEMAVKEKEKAVAINKLCVYLSESHKEEYYYFVVGISIIILFLLSIVLSGSLYKSGKHLKEQRLNLNDKMLALITKENTIMSLTESNKTLTEQIVSDREHQFLKYNENREILLSQIEKVHVIVTPRSKQIKDASSLYELMNTHFFHLADKLEVTYKLHIDEIRVCFVVLLGFSHKEIANILCCSEKSISQKKYRVGKKLNTTGAELREFLIRTACNYPY